MSFLLLPNPVGRIVAGKVMVYCYVWSRNDKGGLSKVRLDGLPDS